MKKLAFAFTVFAVLASACSPSKKDIALLEQIETLAVENPDSALVLLDSLPYSALQNREFRSRVTIAEAEAMYQNSEIMGKDSILADVLDFYRLREKDPRRYRAYFLSGYQHYLKKEYGEAIIDYLNAEHTAALTTDTLALGLVYRAMGDTFKKMEDYTSSLEFFQKSHDMFQQTDAKAYRIYSIVDLARACFNAFQNDKCIELLTDSIFNYYKDDKITFSEIIRLKSKAFSMKYEYDSALCYYSVLRKEYPEYMSDSDWRNIGHAYYKRGDYEKIIECNDSLLALCSGDKWLEHLLARKNTDFEKAYNLLYEEYSESNDYFINITQNDMRGILLSYYQIQFNNISNEKKNIKKATIISIVFLSIFLVICLIVFLQYRKRQNKLMNSNMSIIADLTDSLKQKDETIALLDKEKNGKLMISLPPDFNALDILCCNYYNYSDSPNMQRKIYKETMTLLKKFQEGGDNIKDLINFVNNKSDNLYQTFCNENTNLNDVEKRLFLYILLGFSTITISVFLGLSTNQVYAKKTYLKSKIKKNGGENTERFLHFF